MPEQRVCNHCGSTNFSPDGRCRPCRSAAARERLKDPEVRARARAAGRKFWAKEDTKAKRAEYLNDPIVRQRYRVHVANYRAKPENKEKRMTQEARNVENAKARARRATPEGRARYETVRKAYYARPEVKARKAAYEAKQRKTKAYREWFMAYTAQRLKESVQLRVHKAMTTRVHDLLRQEKGGLSWQRLVGYSREDLMRHLERQFTRGMTWQNYGRGKGKWQIDHVLPVSGFSFQTANDQDFRACWALTNLRPAWATDNAAKGGRRTHLL